jgi:pimeloyl-ACP methyl ester carboxylesterase
MVRLKASGDSQGSLFVNPGGPGGSGVDMVAGSGEAMFSDDLRAGYDIIGFDPRGISRSDGIECLDDAQTDEYLSDTYDGTSEEGLDKSVEWMKRIAAACEKNSGEILPFMDTYSAARDLDVLRTSVGSEKLDYLGFSYGTYLGSTFADVYPERVGKFVLDGVMDPSLNGEQITEGQAAGFDHAYEQFAAYCLEQGEDCPLKGPDAADGKQQLSDLLDSIADQPLDSGDPDRPLTGALASSAVMTLMYQDELWDFGISALGQAANGDGSQLLLLADLSNGREDDGSYTGNGSYSIMAVNCLDHPAPASLEYQKQKTAELLEKFPEVGFTAYDQTLCDQWPVQPMREPAPISASGAPTIVLIGTTGDPATPYTWAESLNKQLDDSVLLTFEGNGHTAYGRSGGCIEEAVDGYFLEDTIPEDGLTCSV